jgi:hypothetical protein
MEKRISVEQYVAAAILLFIAHQFGLVARRKKPAF